MQVTLGCMQPAGGRLNVPELEFQYNLSKPLFTLLLREQIMTEHISSSRTRPKMKKDELLSSFWRKNIRLQTEQKVYHFHVHHNKMSFSCTNAFMYAYS